MADRAGRNWLMALHKPPKPRRRKVRATVLDPEDWPTLAGPHPRDLPANGPAKPFSGLTDGSGVRDAHA